MAQRQFKSTDTSLWTERYGNGSDGSVTLGNTTYTDSNETFTGTVGSTTGTAGGSSLANNDLVIIHQTQGATANTEPNWELNKIVSGGGTTSLTFKYPLTRTYTAKSQILKMKQYRSFTLSAGAKLYPSTWATTGTKGGIFAIFVKGTATIAGTIQAINPSASWIGSGYKWGYYVSDGLGEGCRAEGWVQPGSTNGDTNASGNAGGGGAGGGGNVPGAGGGGGGNGTAGTAGMVNKNGDRAGGQGGAVAGNAALTTMLFGGGGGGGAGNGTWGYAKSGSYGGGIVLIIAKNIIVTGSISMTAPAPATDMVSDEIGAGGGGAGGSILLKCKTATLGSGLVVANGAIGAGHSNACRDGGNGGAGRIHIDYFTSYTGTTSPTIDATKDIALVSSDFHGGII